MSADICLQGGAEFRTGCEPMDRLMIEAGHRRSELVLVAPFAGRPGRERRMAGDNAARWYRELGATQLEVAAEEGPGFEQALAVAGLLVLPGGSPQRLLEALSPSIDALQAAVHNGTAISGASAGAMVLCRWTVLPEGRRRVTAGLGVVGVDLVLPHYSGGTGWLDVARDVLPAGALVLGLPERSGTIVHPDGRRTDAGVHPVSVVGAGDGVRPD